MIAVGLRCVCVRQQLFISSVKVRNGSLASSDENCLLKRVIKASDSGYVLIFREEECEYHF